MTTWTDQSTIQSAWRTQEINTGTTLLYNAPFPYSLDYITYDGYYVSGNTDWSSSDLNQTSWRDA